MRNLLIVTLIAVLLFAPSAHAFDLLKFLSESVIETDLWQTREWYWATPDNMRTLPSGLPVYETNSALAGREWEQVEAHIRLAPLVLDAIITDEKLARIIHIARVAAHSYVVINNNRNLVRGGMSPRFMVSYRWEF